MLEHLDDVRSDMSVFHRIDDVEQMDSQRFFQHAVRLAAYQGVIAARLEENNDGEQRKNVELNDLTSSAEYNGVVSMARG